MRCNDGKIRQLDAKLIVACAIARSILPPEAASTITIANIV